MYNILPKTQNTMITEKFSPAELRLIRRKLSAYGSSGEDESFY
jgi:hypothetical protein